MFVEITKRQKFLSIYGHDGVTFVPKEEVGISEHKLKKYNRDGHYPPLLTELYQYPADIEKVSVTVGYGVQAGSGEWQVFKNRSQAKEAFLEENEKFNEEMGVLFEHV